MEQFERAQEKFICPRRSEVPSTFHPTEKDSWDIQGKDLTCTFCGSWHPEEFMEWVRNGEGRLEATDKRYKVYVNRPGIKSATDGAIKFYSMHHPAETLHKDAEEVIARLMKDKIPFA